MKTLIISIIIMAIMAVSVFAVSANAAAITSATRSASLSSGLRHFVNNLNYKEGVNGYATCWIDGSDNKMVIVRYDSDSYEIYEDGINGVVLIGTIDGSFGVPYNNAGKLAMCKLNTEHNAFFYSSVHCLGGYGLILSREISGDLLDGKYPSPSIPGKPIDFTTIVPKVSAKTNVGNEA